MRTVPISHEQLATILSRPGYHLARENRPLRSQKSKQPKSPPKPETRGQQPAGLNGEGKKRKYGNVPVIQDGIRFDSRKEAKRHGKLILLERAGKIRSLTRQRTFSLTVAGIRICAYRCDFEYFELGDDGVWTWIVEDVKGHRTREYKIKKNLMLALWKVDIRET